MSNLAKVWNVLEHQLTDIDDKFRDINSGGCGIMANIVAEQLDLLSVGYSIACIKSWSCDRDMSIEEVNHAIDNEDTSTIPNAHILIEINGQFFDCSGLVETEESTVAARIDRETLQRMIDADCWNRCFDRSQTEGMREFTGNVFKKNFG